MRPGRPLALFLLAAGLVALMPVPRAEADTIRLRDGTVLTTDSVEVLDGRILVRTEQDGAVVPVEFPFGRFPPRTVLKLLDKTTDQTDAAQRLRGARIALEVGLPREARKRFLDAARMDPALKAQADQGLDELKFAEATQAFTELEAELRAGKDPAKVHAALEALLVGPHAHHFSVAQLKRIGMLTKLAKRLADRAAERKADAEKKKKARKGKPAKPTRPDTPPPRRDTEASPYAPGSYADERWRKRHPHAPRNPPKVPGRARPPLQGERGGGVPPRGPNGGQKSGGNQGPGGVRGGQGGGSPPGSSGGGSSGGGQGTGLER